MSSESDPSKVLTSPTKLRLHKRHYLEEVVQKNVNLRREKSIPVDLSSISKIGSTITRCTSDREEQLNTSLSNSLSAKKLKAEYGYLESESLQGSTFFEESKAESTYMIALSAVQNARETTDGIDAKQTLLQFVEECFDLPEVRKNELQETCKRVERPKMKLTCRVLKAKDLVIKDTSGSELYCQLGILNEHHLEKDMTKQKKNVKEWQKEKLIESAGMTSVTPRTLEPEWNEVVELCSSKPRKELLVIEIWCSDEASGGGVMKKGSFVGRFFYPLLHIPTSGIEKTFNIRSHSGRTDRGFIALKLRIQQEKCLIDFSELICAVVNTCAKEEGSYIRRWSGELTPNAEKLLEEYAVFNDIDDLSKACIYLSVLVKYHKLYAVNMAVICDLIKKIKDHITLSRTSPPVAHSLWKKFLADLTELYDEMEGVMKNHLCMFDLEFDKDLEKIEECIQTLCELYSFQPFTEQLLPGSGSLSEMLEKCIAIAVHKWFAIQQAQTQPQVKTERAYLLAFKDLSEVCLHQCHTARSINRVFHKAGVDYFSIFYVALDPLIGKEPETVLKQPSAATDATTYGVYLNCREIAKMVQHVDRSGLLYSVCDHLLLPQYHDWFKNMVKNWITLAADRCKKYIINAIEDDSAIAITEQVKLSNSAVDVTGFLIQLGNFWKNLEWPQAIAAYGFASNVMEEINSCAQFYVEKVAKRLTSEDVFDEQGKFRATEKLCIVLNDMQHVRQEISYLEEKLEFKSFYKWLDSEGEHNLGKPCEEMVKKLLHSADDDIYNRMSKIMKEVTDKLSPDIQAYVRDVVSDVKTVVTQDDHAVIAPLMEFLMSNLQTFASHLFPDVLQIILGNLWQVSLGCVHRCLNDVQLKKGSNSAGLHKRSFTMLTELKDFYYSDGDGLEETVLLTDDYNRLHSQLDVLRLPTDQLILRFLSELAEFQHRELEGDKQLGTLTLRVGVCHNKNESMVEVCVLKGENLPGMSRNGVSDLFVQLSLMPQWAFKKNPDTLYRTSVQKKTVNPEYNEEFSIPATVDEMQTEGAVLLLSLFHCNNFTADYFAGMCVIACKDILQSTTDLQPMAELTLPVFRFIDMTFSFAEIEARTGFGDAKAQLFKTNVKKLLVYLPRPRSKSRSKSRGGSVSNLEELQARPVSLS